MVAQHTATATRKPTKSAYKPRIQFVSADAYALPSESYGGHILYLVTVLGPGAAICECTGYTYRKTCKHCVLALAAHAYRAHPSHLQSAALPEKENGLGVRVASTGEGYEVYELRTGALICTVDDPATAGLPTARPTQSVDWADLGAEFAALPVPSFDFRSQVAPVPAFIPAPPAFSELFAA